jgi:hypothetical protein
MWGFNIGVYPADLIDVLPFNAVILAPFKKGTNLGKLLLNY